jgi:hypothetical protein
MNLEVKKEKEKEKVRKLAYYKLNNNGLNETI